MPRNQAFKNQSVLSESMREFVYSKIVHGGESIKGLAASTGIDMRRIAAVVRLKQIEKQWAEQGKQLATPYRKAVLDMLPSFGTYHQNRGFAYENINEIHTHAYTKQQLFVPVSESRQFTREDAARAFHTRMLSPDKRMPIPELIQVEKDVISGKQSHQKSMLELQDKAAKEQVALAEKDRLAAEAEEARTNRVATDRFEFRIQDINAENVGPHGRAPTVVGWRYGVPSHDRKKGQVKIPTSVG
ncbi:uncharacterized protein SPSK_06456 [Sporothrix schenckii 1099-18]|nr:uncharacterized protein SPSK_06456 [Sporothrix schenckii 1099-18]KJR89692.1 hypothetical protein SPSK_06456 [Sporothrix schenckii 1099-18]